jgi:hypothetical protein
VGSTHVLSFGGSACPLQSVSCLLDGSTGLRLHSLASSMPFRTAVGVLVVLCRLPGTKQSCQHMAWSLSSRSACSQVRCDSMKVCVLCFQGHDHSSSNSHQASRQTLQPMQSPAGSPGSWLVLCGGCIRGVTFWARQLGMSSSNPNKLLALQLTAAPSVCENPHLLQLHPYEQRLRRCKAKSIPYTKPCGSTKQQ